ncbi:Alpha/Beta hydrolase protein [Tricharina praecox]|uniref:Alpha/Beta hydrolase protein n=1 Tax=Tricharina praecox TaxID=43433 RepID=UPI002220E183|nr:Alpha/Beta hydrolase protein [Tricharina praecox]KAI5842275.1 Alpha/Beta hydrolase protein [Tricharina praecox]
MSLRTSFEWATHTYQSTPATELDIFKPSTHTSSSPPRKTLIMFHGGGLVTGQRQGMVPEDVAIPLLVSGWIVISADYSLFPQADGLSLLRDISALETWLTTHASAEGIDTTHVAVIGASAGVFLAVLAAAHWKTVRPQALLDYYGMLDLGAPWYSADKSSSPPVVIGIPTDDLEEAEFAAILGSNEVLTNDLVVFGVTPPGGRFRFFLWAVKQGVLLDFLFGRHQSQRERGMTEVPEDMHSQLLPFDLVKSMPPTWVIHGGADSVVLPTDSRRFVELLKAEGIQVEYTEVEGADHGLVGVPPRQGVEQAVEFLEKWVV